MKYSQNNLNSSLYDTLGLFCTKFYDLPSIMSSIMNFYIPKATNCHVKLLNEENLIKELNTKCKSSCKGIILLDEPSNDLQRCLYSKIPIVSLKYSEKNNVKCILPNPSYIGALSAQCIVKYGYNNIYYIESNCDKYFSLMKESFVNCINNSLSSSVNHKFVKVSIKDENKFKLITKEILSKKTSQSALFFDSYQQSIEFIKRVNFDDENIHNTLGVIAYNYLTEIKDKITINITCVTPDLNKLIFEVLKYFNDKTVRKSLNNFEPKYINTAVLNAGMTTRKTVNNNGLTVEKITQYIKDNHHNSISVVDIAKHIKVSSKTLSRILRATLNISTKKLIIKIKLEKIKEILIKSNYKLSYVAAISGYDNVEHMCRSFKKQYYGVTPTTFRNYVGSSCRLANKSKITEYTQSKDRYAIIPNTKTEFWELVERGIERFIKDSSISIDIIYPESNTFKKQNKIISDLLKMGYKGAAISVISPTMQNKTINTIASKMHIVTIDSDAPKSNRIAFIGPSQYESGIAAAKEILKLKSSNKIAVFTGNPKSENSINRILGMNHILRKSRLKINCIKNDCGDFNKAIKNVSHVINNLTDINTFVGLWSYNGPAIIEALIRSNKFNKKIKVIAFDDDYLTLQNIELGYIHCSIAFRSFIYGYKTAKYFESCNKLYSEERHPFKWVNTGFEIINKKNLDRYKVLFK